MMEEAQTDSTTEEYPWLGEEDYTLVQEPEPLAHGSEVEVEIIKCKVREDTFDVLVTVKVTDVGPLDIIPATVPLLNYYFSAAKREDQTSEEMRKLGNKRFLEGFQISSAEQSTPSFWVGKQAWNILRLQPPKDPYPASNALGQFVTK